MDDEGQKEEIELHMARAFFACAWSDYQERSEDGVNLSGVEIFDVLPDDLDAAAADAAKELVSGLEDYHGIGLCEIFVTAKAISRHYNGGDRKRTAEMFGHYAAMGAMGHGVSLWDALGSEADKWVRADVLYIEFSAYDLVGDEYEDLPY